MRQRASTRVGRQEGIPPDGRLHLYQLVASFIPIPRPVPSLFISFGWLRCMPIAIVFSLRVVSYDCLALAPHGLIEVGLFQFIWIQSWHSEKVVEEPLNHEARLVIVAFA